MPQYRDLSDYIRSRILDWNQTRDDKLTTVSLSEALGFGRSYINSAINQQFQPSVKRCRQIAEFFGDDPSIILQAVGYQEPDKAGRPLIADLVQIASSLPPESLQEILRYARYQKTLSLALQGENET